MTTENIERKKALIVGVLSQDGYYLTELLLRKGYEVHGLARYVSTFNQERVKDFVDRDRFILHYGDTTESGHLSAILLSVMPDEIYCLAAISNVGISFDMPEYNLNVAALTPLRILEAMRAHKIPARFFHASSSEIFGPSTPPQSEETPLYPVTPYGIAKTTAHHLVCMYRASYGMFAANGILFNHESPRRPENFVTRKISKGVASITAGRAQKIFLGNLEAKRDWGYAPEYVEAMWRILQHNKPDDFVIATGESHSVRDFVEEAFKAVHIANWQQYVEVSDAHKRVAGGAAFQGDASKAWRELGWRAGVAFKDLVRTMVESDCKELGVSLDTAKSV